MRERPTILQDQVGRLYREIMLASHSDQDLEGRLGAIEELTADIARCSSSSLDEIALKLDIVVRRIHDEVVPGVPGVVLTYFLLRGAVDDLQLILQNHRGRDASCR